MKNENCEIDKKNLYCKKHNCRVKYMDISSKKRQWVECKKKYAYVSRKTKK